MKKTLLILTILLIGTLSWAEEMHFLPQHWVLGKVEGPAGLLPLAQGKKIHLFKLSQPQAVIADEVGAKGNAGAENQFSLNAFRLPSWQPGEILIAKLEPFKGPLGESGPTYSGVTQVKSSASGYQEATLQIVEETKILGAIEVSPTSLTFSGEQYTPLPSQTLTISNSSSTTLNYTLSKKEAWLALSKTEGTLEPGKKTSVEVSIDQKAGWLEATDYSDTITVSDLSALADPKAVNVAVKISAPPGPVPPEISNLNIERLADGSLKISWNQKPADLAVDIYLNTGSLNNPNWQKADLSSDSFEVHLDENYILHKNQVGQGADEIYYIIVPKDEKIDVAPIIGKVNLVCEKGFNLVSFPFDFGNKNSLDEVIGNQLSKGSAKDGDIFFDKKSAASFSYKWAYLNNDGAWKNVDDNGNPNFTLHPEKGYFIWHQQNDPKTVTIVGKVISQTTVATLEEGFNLIGTIYPLELDLKDAGFTNAYAADAKEADIVFKKKGPESFSYHWSFYKQPEKTWNNADDPQLASEFKLSPFNGYYYWRRNGQGKLVWVKEE